MEHFEGLDLRDFWDDSDYARDHYVDVAPSGGTIRELERRLGFRLPSSYVALARLQNGGFPRRTCHSADPTSWAHDHIAITGIFSIGSRKPCSLGGAYGSQFWATEWGYPPLGIYFADCPSAGYDMVALDYRSCGPNGEPQVVHVDQGFDYKVTFVASSFEAFIRGLRWEEAFDAD